MTIRTSLRKIRRTLTGYTPLVEVSISKENLLHNLRTYQKRYPDLQFAPVLKSNAYGHDLGTIARLLDHEKIAFFVVDSYYEARRLRRANVRSRILVMGYVRPEDIAKSKLPNVDFGITDLEQLRALTELVKHPVRIHFKLDTGMRRLGIPESHVSFAEDLIKDQPLLELVGIASHFADADGEDETFTRAQVDVWQAVAKELLLAFPSIEYRHIAATKGVRFNDATGTNVARLGIGLYGFDTSPSAEAPLRPILELRTLIASVREIQAGESVGYNATYTADHAMKIATVPVGYYEGIDRRLSSKGAMLVEGVVCPIVGRVSMNMASIDVTHVPDVAPGDTVVAVSRNPSDANSVSNIVRTVSTPEYAETEYVILTHFAPHLERVVE
ncbi:MAG: Alanine racemase [Parcubacteria group bacterium]|nr:Alanine racemase [Parcubacteria group bacterium]